MADDAKTWTTFESRLYTQSLLDSGLPIASCPFCNYAEVDERPHPSTKPSSAILVTIGCLIYAGLCSILLTLLLAVPPLLVPAGLIIFTMHRLRPSLTTHALQPLLHLHTTFLSTTLPGPLRSQRRHNSSLANGRRFTCRRPGCLRVSCLRCHAPWRDIHACHASARLALRHAVEAAQAHAVKRTCPRCAVSFVKADGCNKLVCPCGYRMCYVCRADVGGVGYAHFCQHFRPDPDAGGCKECDRCDLYRVEDEEVVRRRARERAEREWWEGEGRELRAEEGEALVRELHRGEFAL